MTRLLHVFALGALAAGLVGCGESEPSRPAIIPPMPSPSPGPAGTPQPRADGLPFEVTKFPGRQGTSTRTVVMELFTGAQCPPCVAADVAFDGLQKAYQPSELILIQYHLHIPGPDPLTSPASEARAKYYGVRSTPSTFFNGKSQARGGGGMGQAKAKFDQYRSIIDPLLEKPAQAEVTVQAQRSNDAITIDAEVSGLTGGAQGKRLWLVLVEKTVHYAGRNGLPVHHQVVRALPGGPGGIALKEGGGKHSVQVDLGKVRASLAEYLDTYAKKRPFPSSDRPLDLKGLRVIAFVQDDSTKEILDGAQAEVRE